MNYKLLQNVQSVLDDFVNKKEAAGLNLLVCKDGCELGYWQSGLADVAAGRAYNRDTIARLYSMTKPVTAVAAMILIEEGKLDFAVEYYSDIYRDDILGTGNYLMTQPIISYNVIYLVRNEE